MTPAAHDFTDVAAKAGKPDLGDLLLELAGKSAGRMLTAKRHVRILEDAYSLLDTGQRLTARTRIALLESRWGPLGRGTPDGQKSAINDGGLAEISPELRVARWLSKRSKWSRYIRVLNRSATYFMGGGTCLSDALWHGYGLETEGVLTMVGLSSFTEWVIELRIAERTAERTYGPGSLCAWWATEMVPTDGEDTSYGLCISLATELCRGRLPRHR